MLRLGLVAATIALSSVTGIANAACPASIAGSYSKYSIRYQVDGAEQTSVGTHVYSAVGADGAGTETIYQWVSLVNPHDNTAEAKISKPVRKYKYDKTTCRGYTWVADDSEVTVAGTLTIRFFAVAESGNTIYQIQGPTNYPQDALGNPVPFSASQTWPSKWTPTSAAVNILTKQ